MIIIIIIVKEQCIDNNTLACTYNIIDKQIAHIHPQTFATALVIEPSARTPNIDGAFKK